ncbi:uncharacterized protein LOC130113074 [Lampris incognitus]|uniref:uncharacterized protein LOC130113074 n=1 Tax=Lampris incognitus TaxID=2546036 RepID=UPI0024B4E30F|nr:uncharacterized protein LOC130113074 [Lampris incognitus]
MDPWILLAALTLVPVEAESDPNLSHSTQPTVIPSNHTKASSTNPIPSCTCPDVSPSIAPLPPAGKPPSPTLGVFTVQWKDKSCTGDVVVSVLNVSTTRPSFDSLCYVSWPAVRGLLAKVCESKVGCQGKPIWSQGSKTSTGFNITEEGGMKVASCASLTVQCSELTACRGLTGYKVVTALLCVVLLLILLTRFAGPTVQVLQRRLSDKRRSRWIGPTQSQSVTYHRGKTAVQNDDADKRLSYPGSPVGAHPPVLLHPAAVEEDRSID